MKTIPFRTLTNFKNPNLFLIHFQLTIFFPIISGDDKRNDRSNFEISLCLWGILY